MTQVTEAVYIQGVLKALEDLRLCKGQRVRLVLQARSATAVDCTRVLQGRELGRRHRRHRLSVGYGASQRGQGRPAGRRRKPLTALARAVRCC